MEYRTSVAGPPRDLASGRVVAPGEAVAAGALDLDDPHDRRLVDEGVLRPTGEAPEPEPLRGAELDRRAAELDIDGRSDMTAPEKREAIAAAEAAAEEGEGE